MADLEVERDAARRRLRRRVRWAIGIFVVGLGLAGVTAVPIQWELDLLTRTLPRPGAAGGSASEAYIALVQWLDKVRAGVAVVAEKYPWMAYGTDWLAFGHFAITLAFIGPWRDPVRNRWVIEFGMMACVAVLPYAMIFGALRGIPWWWRMIDCAFGVFGLVPLGLARRWALEMERMGERLRPGAGRNEPRTQ